MLAIEQGQGHEGARQGAQGSAGTTAIPQTLSLSWGRAELGRLAPSFTALDPVSAEPIVVAYAAKESTIATSAPADKRDAARTGGGEQASRSCSAC